MRTPNMWSCGLVVIATLASCKGSDSGSGATGGAVVPSGSGGSAAPAGLGLQTICNVVQAVRLDADRLRHQVQDALDRYVSATPDARPGVAGELLAMCNDASFLHTRMGFWIDVLTANDARLKDVTDLAIGIQNAGRFGCPVGVPPVETYAEQIATPLRNQMDKADRDELAIEASCRKLVAPPTK